MKRVWAVLVAFGTLPAIAGCTTVTGPTLSAAEFQQRYPASLGKLAPGDRVRIALYGDEALTGEYDVAGDGSVSLPLVGAIPAAGLSIDGFRQAVEARLSQGFYQSPRVSAQVVSVQPIYVLGEVTRAGAYPFAVDMTLSKAAALAGGFTYRARENIVGLRRAGADDEVLVVADKALVLAPGDTVRILERHF